MSLLVPETTNYSWSMGEPWAPAAPRLHLSPASLSTAMGRGRCPVHGARWPQASGLVACRLLGQSQASSLADTAWTSRDRHLALAVPAQAASRDACDLPSVAEWCLSAHRAGRAVCAWPGPSLQAQEQAKVSAHGTACGKPWALDPAAPSTWQCPWKQAFGAPSHAFLSRGCHWPPKWGVLSPAVSP